MKLITTALVLFLIISLPNAVTCQSKIDVPAGVEQAFNAKFPAAAKVKWELEEEGEYEAAFKLKGKEMSANFKTDGTWLETETELSKKDLPAAVMATIKSNFGGYKISEVEMTETSVRGKTYEVEVKIGKKTVEATVGADGQLLEQEVDDEEDQG